MKNTSIELSGFADSVLEKIKKVIGSTTGPVPLHAPEFRGNEWNYVKECLDTGWVSSVGSYVNRFEKDLAEFSGSKFAIVTMNGTAALHMACVLNDVGYGDEVLMPALTFIATANAVAYTQATPHFVEVDETSLGVDPEKLSKYLDSIVVMRGGESFNRNTNRRIRALIPMHTFGHPVDMEPLIEICARYNIRLIEDAAEALGSYYKGRHCGTLAPIGTLSFNGNKVVTTGGGGALLIQDEAIALKAKHLTTTGKVPHAWEFFHDTLAYNYRLPNINSALGCAQLELLPSALERKRKIAMKYAEAFEGLEGARIHLGPSYGTSNYWLNALILSPSHAGARNLILEKTNSSGVMTRPIWRLMSELPMYKECPKMDLEVSESLQTRLVNVPSSPSLMDQ